jgi:hypothetical protein
MEGDSTYARANRLKILGVRLARGAEIDPKSWRDLSAKEYDRYLHFRMTLPPQDALYRAVFTEPA